MVSLSLSIIIKGTATAGLGIAIIKNVNPLIENHTIPCVYRNTGTGNTTFSSISINKYESDTIILCDSNNTSFDEVRINTTFMIK